MSEKRGVKKFIFALSASVYGNAEELPVKEDAKPNPISPLGMSSYVKEYYCIKWGEIYDLNILCLRIPNVYGPGQEISGEPGVITTFMNNIVSGRNLIILGYGFKDKGINSKIIEYMFYSNKNKIIIIDIKSEDQILKESSQQ